MKLSKLIFETPEKGISLDYLIQQRSDFHLVQILEYASGICSALMELHFRHIVHRNICPQNLIYFPSENLFKLFGLEVPSLKTSSLVETSLPYISPEQTGRTSFRVDDRSDLYSLGMVFYEMLVGHTAFKTRGLSEWIYHHLTKIPVSPSQINPQVPQPVSNIVLKLLNKIPKDRYQSAYGLKADIERCLTQLKEEHKIVPFNLAEKDIHLDLQPPHRLYERENDLDSLHSAFERVFSTGNMELALVSGHAGIGKTSLILSFFKNISQPCFIIRGKFDEQNRVAPYFAIRQAFANLVRQLLTRSEEELELWKTQFSHSFPFFSSIITHLVPEFRFLLGEHPPVFTQMGTEAKQQVHNAFKQLVQIFARPNHPLVLFLDDLQWADEGSLDLLEFLVREDLTSFFLIVAFRDQNPRNQEQNELHPTLRSWLKPGNFKAPITSIQLKPITRDSLNLMMKDAFKQTSTVIDPLTELIFNKTAGNPFFCIQILKNINLKNFIWFNSSQEKWELDSNAILKMDCSDNVLDLMKNKMKSLPSSAQDLLGVAAALGDSFQDHTLIHACGWEGSRVNQTMQLLTDLGFLIETFQETETEYSFAHDRIRQAAYLFIPEQKRTHLHLQIGRHLLSALGPDSINFSTPLSLSIVNHFNFAFSLLHDPDEIKNVVHLNLMAGRASKKTTTYQSALHYFLKASELLENQKSNFNPELAYSIDYELAHSYFLLGTGEKAQNLLENLLCLDAPPAQKVPTLLLSIQVNTALGDLSRAITSVRSTLKPLGVDLPIHPTNLQVSEEFSNTWRRLGNTQVGDLIHLPSMVDEKMKSAMEILSTVLAAAMFANSNLFAVTLCKMVQISILFGNSRTSPLGYALFGMTLGPSYSRDSTKSYEFGELAILLSERDGFSDYRHRVLHCFGAFLTHWKYHFKTCIPIVGQAFNEAVRTGDILYSSYSKVHLSTLLFILGDELTQVLKALDETIQFVGNLGLYGARLIVTAHRQMIKCLMGKTFTLGGFSDDQFDQKEFECILKQRFPLGQCWYYIRNTISSCILGNHARAIQFASQAIPLLRYTPCSLEVIDFYYYYSVSLAANYGEVSTQEQKQFLSILMENEKLLHSWSQGCPSNFENMHDLIHAERLRLTGAFWDATQFYEKAIRSAESNGFIHKQALSCETAAYFFKMGKLDTLGAQYLSQAHRLYSCWGAHAKVKQLEMCFPELCQRKEWIKNEWVEADGKELKSSDIDLMSVIEASQVISRELDPDRLLKSICHILLKQSGATTGCVLLNRDDALSIQAKAHCSEITDIQNPPNTLLNPSNRLMTSEEVPLSVVQFTFRTSENVLLHEAIHSEDFGSDPYIQRNQLKSIISLPMKSQGKLVGIVYLENDLVPGAFTPEKIKTLELIIHQAAITIEISDVYSTNISLIQKLEEALKTRDEFLAIASHELKTPLTSLKLQLSLLLKAFKDQKLKGLHSDFLFYQMALRSEHQANRLLALSNDLLDISTIKSGNFKIEFSQFNLSNLILRILDDLKLESKARAQEIVSMISKDIVYRGDQRRLEQVFLNLMNNAQKFGAGKPIEVTLSEEENAIEFSVRNQGPIIQKEDWARIFEPFERAVSYKNYGGLGLGLHIAKKIVDAHQGKITGVSDERTGTLFKVSLPKEGNLINPS